MIEVYSLSGERVALLTPESDGVSNAILTEELNGPVTLQFVLPRDNPKWAYMTDGYRLRAGGHEFIIVGTEEQRGQDGKLLSNVQAEESWIELGNLYGNYLRVESYNATAWGVINKLLTQGYGSVPTPTGWRPGTVEPAGTRDLVGERESCLYYLWKVRELWGGDLVFNSLTKTVSLYNSYGQDRDIVFRYDKNLKSISRSVDYSSLCTRLYPYGKDGLTIMTETPGYVPYIENFSYTSRVIERVWVSQDIDDPDVLYEVAQRLLEQWAWPRVSYRLALLDLREVTGHRFEVFGLGDSIKVYDPDLGLNTRVRVVKRSYNLFAPEQCEVELANTTLGLESEWDKVRHAGNVVNEVVMPQKKISGRQVKITDEEFLATGDGYTKMVDNGIQTYDAQGRLRVHLGQYAPGVFGLWTDQGVIEAGHISGVTIEGSTIVGNLIKTAPAGDKLIMDSEGLKGDAAGDIRMKLLFDQLQFLLGGVVRGMLKAGYDGQYYFELRAANSMRLYAAGECFLDSNGLVVQIYTAPYAGGPKKIFEFTPEGDLVVPRNLSTNPNSGGVSTDYITFRPTVAPGGSQGRVFYNGEDWHLKLYTPYGWRTIALTSDIPPPPPTYTFERRSGTVSDTSPSTTLYFSGTISKVLGVWSGHQRINAAQTGGGDGYSYVTVTAAHVDGAAGWSVNVYAAAVLA